MKMKTSKKYYLTSVRMCYANSPQSCPTPCNPIDCSSPGFSVHGILQTRKLEWIAIPFSRGPSQSRNWTGISCLLHWQVGSLSLAPPGITLLEGLSSKRQENKTWLGCGELETSVYFWWECKFVQSLLKTVWSFLKN